MSRSTTTSWGWLGAAAGVAVGLLDSLLLTALGAGMRVDDGAFHVILSSFLMMMFGVLGYALGRLAEERRRARADAATIREQMISLERTQLALAEQEKLAAIGRLAAGVAHEVRNPLGIIRSSAAMIRNSVDPSGDIRRACEFICEETDRLNGFIASLLDFARPLHPNARSVSGEEIVERAERLVEPALSGRHVRIERRIAGDVSRLRLDPDLTSQALFGLVSNAAEAVGRGGRIEIAMRRESGGGVSIEVADDGPGVASSEREQVFEPFFTSKVSGTGLGLPMARRVIEVQGGRCRYVPDSGLGEGGRGARFRIELPNADGAERISA